MDPNSSLGKICLGENVVEISSDKIEGSGDWDSLEYQDTANSGGKMETKAMVLHKMDTEEVSDRFVAPCFVNRLEAYDGEINLGVEENMISNEYADPLLDFNLDDIPLLGGEEVFSFVCKMGKSSHNKKRAMENLNLFYQDIGTSSSTGRHLTQEEAAKESLAIRISQKFTLLEEEGVTTLIAKFLILDIPIDRDAPIVVGQGFLSERSLALQPVSNPFRKISIWKKAVSFFGSLLVPIKYVNWKPDYKGCYTKEEEATGQWRTKIRTMGGNDAEVGSSRSKRSRQFEIVEEVLLPQVHHDFLLWEGCNNEKGEFRFVNESCLYYYKPNFEGDSQNDHLWLVQRTTGYDKIQKNDLWLLSMFKARHQNGYANVAWLIARWMKRKGAGTQRESPIFCGQFITKIARKTRVLTDAVLRSLSAPIYCRDLDTTTLRELIDSKGRLILEDPQPGVPRVGIPRPWRASMQDLYDRYQGVFEHIDGVYSVLLQGNPTSYAQPQYDQYYQQYPPLSPQYQQQQQDDDE
nr:hypothetical protein [Tanacetum cinerariifolium]GEY78414.1 hypothetical protein [Tanacetum cinerariifolium]